jgi:hypothetical protein
MRQTRYEKKEMTGAECGVLILIDPPGRARRRRGIAFLPKVGRTLCLLSYKSSFLFTINKYCYMYMHGTYMYSKSEISSSSYRVDILILMVNNSRIPYVHLT